MIGVCCQASSLGKPSTTIESSTEYISYLGSGGSIWARDGLKVSSKHSITVQRMNVADPISLDAHIEYALSFHCTGCHALGKKALGKKKEKNRWNKCDNRCRGDVAPVYAEDSLEAGQT